MQLYGVVVLVSPHDREGSAEVLHGRYEPAATELFQQVVRPGMTVVVVGANVGVNTVLGARGVGPSGRVVAFDPDPLTREPLAGSVAANGAPDREVQDGEFAECIEQVGGLDFYAVPLRAPLAGNRPGRICVLSRRAG